MSDLTYSHLHGETTRALCRLVRLRTTVGAPVLTVAGWWTLTGWTGRAGLWPVLLSAVAAFSFIAFAQVYNDVKDVRLDAGSKPGRPIPSGVISERFARILPAALIAAAVGASRAVGRVGLGA